MSKETKVLLVLVDDVSEKTLREFLMLGCYKFSTAYLQETDPLAPVEFPKEGNPE
jgi:hypothetical protein